MNALVASAGLVSVLLLSGPNVFGFPPYRSTDAATADPGFIEIRLGLIGAEREEGDTTYSSPLLRTNIGLPRDIELIAEFEYRPDENRVNHGAVGFKWVPLRGFPSVGVEALALFPVSSDHDGAGVESQLVVTFRREPYQLHVNAGGFYDQRHEETERGWRLSILGEAKTGRFRPGVEVFAKKIEGNPIRVQVGSGIIIDMGNFDIRTGIHVGLSTEAPDMTGSLWVTWKWPLWQ